MSQRHDNLQAGIQAAAGYWQNIAATAHEPSANGRQYREPFGLREALTADEVGAIGAIISRYFNNGAVYKKRGESDGLEAGQLKGVLDELSAKGAVRLRGAVGWQSSQGADFSRLAAPILHGKISSSLSGSGYATTVHASGHVTASGGEEGYRLIHTPEDSVPVVTAADLENTPWQREITARGLFYDIARGENYARLSSRGEGGVFETVLHNPSLHKAGGQHVLFGYLDPRAADADFRPVDLLDAEKVWKASALLKTDAEIVTADDLSPLNLSARIMRSEFDGAAGGSFVDLGAPIRRLQVEKDSIFVAPDWEDLLWVPAGAEVVVRQERGGWRTDVWQEGSKADARFVACDERGRLSESPFAAPA